MGNDGGMLRRHPVATMLTGVVAVAAAAATVGVAGADPSDTAPTGTSIKHVVVIVGENISFDHYFGTYPSAQNQAGETPFTAKAGTPSVDGLTPTLLTANPNAAQPSRLNPLTPSDLVTCDFNHNYSPEQKAFDGGLMDRFVENTSNGCPTPAQLMGYYDGNAVTGLWNLAQGFAMSDNSYGTAFGSDTTGSIELVSGDTSGVVDDTDPGNLIVSQAAVNNNTAYGNLNPYADMDDCTPGGAAYAFKGKNVGDLLNAKGVSWGWFQGGFKPSSVSGATATCATAHDNVAGASGQDYDAHHDPFQYYRSTSSRHHLPPTSTAAIGTTDQANHQYDLPDFEAALAAGNLPAVSYLKAGHYQDGHPGYSDPVDEGHFIAKYVNLLERSPEWSSTAIVITYDGSDGWYDHKFGGVVRKSNSTEDFLNGNGVCDGGNPALPAANDRCGYGPRQPLLVISPWARPNFVDHTQTDQTSVLRFIEDNWSLGRIGGGSVDSQAGSLGGMFDFDASHPRTPAVLLDETNGTVVPGPAGGGATPTPTPGQATATPVPTTSPTPPPTVKAKSPVGKVKCAVKRSGRKLRLSCRTAKPAKARTALRFRLLRGEKQVAQKAVTLKAKGKRARVTLRPKHRLKRGTYTLKVTISQRGTAPFVQMGKLKLR
jgi:phospholipase C